MGIPLGQTEFAILQEHANSGDRIAYYSQLDDWGYNYGGLALGVVTNDTLSGATANIFFVQNAGRLVTNNELATVSLNLMRLDLAARQAFSGSAQGQELPVDIIQQYHATAFGLIGVSVDAWTPNFVLESLSTNAEREAYWDELLSSTALGSWFETAVEALSPPSLASAAYLAELTAIGALATTAQSGDYGVFDISLGNADGGRLKGGDATDNIVVGSTGADVLIGFDGADRLFGGAGNDILYGGTDGLIPNGDTMDGQSGADTYFASTFDNANDSGTDGALDVYNMDGGSFSDADGVYDGAALIDGLDLPPLPFPFSPFRLASIAEEAATSQTQEAPTLGDLIAAGVLSFGMDADGNRALTIIDEGVVLFTENNANWGDGGFELDLGREDSSIRGDDGNNKISGGSGDQLILGLAGNDRLNGGSGQDEISGGTGNDRLNGGGQNDKLYGDRGDDRVNGGGGDDMLWGGTGADILNGGAGNDQISGGLGDDELKGGGGDDILRGNGGNDNLRGNGGADTFVFADNGGHDHILDFKSQHNDRIMIDVAGFENFEDILAVATQDKRDVVLDFGEENSLRIEKVGIEDLGATDFLF